MPLPRVSHYFAVTPGMSSRAPALASPSAADNTRPHRPRAPYRSWRSGQRAVVKELWTGADVVWTGPEYTDGEHRVCCGDRAVVVDAGRHHVSSFSVLGRGRRRARDGVVIRVDGTANIEVDPRHLEVVAPDHPLRPETDDGAAAWWLDQLEPYDLPLTVASFVPRSFDSVLRVLHPWVGPDGRPARWAQVAADLGAEDIGQLGQRVEAIMIGDADAPEGHHEPDAGRLDHDTVEALVDLLGDATSTPDDVYVAVWDGWGDTPAARFPGAASLPTDARGHFLLRGPLSGVLTSVSATPVGPRPASGIWWPADRSWFVNTEIDFPWTFIAGDTDLARAIHQHPALETQATRHAASANTLPR